ncbi:hypothetical protein KGQ19_44220 [Catenulispora sp. NL8]|uniref:Uncharacterized protein n=1 Tax=Catenulispora pinistramenti TaxID=2705254 RepID=A0ABS5L6E3_9ACTN|nr:hypothetical protein [Catenulispora pinistramenti]MBS2553882.1 hypothetical protein [Catenulispora pinistramenti]
MTEGVKSFETHTPNRNPAHNTSNQQIPPGDQRVTNPVTNSVTNSATNGRAKLA